MAAHIVIGALLSSLGGERAVTLAMTVTSVSETGIFMYSASTSNTSEDSGVTPTSSSFFLSPPPMVGGDFVLIDDWDL